MATKGLTSSSSLPATKGRNRMKKIMMACALALSVAAPAVAQACEGMENHAEAAPASVSPKELMAMTKEKKATPVDANGKETREKQGIVPGAVLLTSSSSYDVKELPADKASKLVFYCANEKCGASHAAAKKASEAGYTNVAVMPAGISGWKQAGNPVAKPNS